MSVDNARAIVALDAGDSDEWGHTLGHHFAVAAMLTALGYTTPDEWEYRPSPMGPAGELAEWPGAEWLDAVTNGDVTASDLLTVGNELLADAARLRADGKDY